MKFITFSEISVGVFP